MKFLRQPEDSEIDEAVRRAYAMRGLQEPSRDQMFAAHKQEPPRFITEMQDQLGLSELEPAHFECRLVPIGDPNMHVQWFRDDKPLFHATRLKPSYDFGFVGLDFDWCFAEDSAVYTVRAWNLYGEATTSARLECLATKSLITDTQLPIELNMGPEGIEELERQLAEPHVRPQMKEGPQPQPPSINQGPEPMTVPEGDPARFRCQVLGHPRPRVTWYLNNSLVVNGSRFKVSFDGVFHTLEIPKTREYDVGEVKIFAKNQFGEDSAATTLDVIPMEDWKSKLRKTNQNIYTRRAEMVSHELKQAFVQRPKLSAKDVATLEHTGGKGKEIKEPTQQAKLQPVGSPPRLTSLPQPIKVKEGQPVRFDVEFTGIPEPTVTWYKESVEIHHSKEFQIAVLRGRSSLYIPEVMMEDEGEYMISVRNEHGVAQTKVKLTVLSREVTISVSSAPTFKTYLRDVRVKCGEPVTIDCMVTGKPQPTLVWQKDGKTLEESSRWKFIADGDNYTLLIYESVMEDAGQYSAIATNEHGKVVSTMLLYIDGTFFHHVYSFFNQLFLFFLFVVAAPAKPSSPDVSKMAAPKLVQPASDVTVAEGECVTLTFKINAYPEPIVKWYHESQLIKQSKYFRMTSNYEKSEYYLTIAEAYPEDHGTYKCVARNKAGETTATVHLYVNAPVQSPVVPHEPVMEPPKFIKSPSDVHTREGEPANFEAIVTGQPPPEVVWLLDGKPIRPGPDVVMRREGSKYTLTMVHTYPEDSGKITCRALNSRGFAEQSCQLSVEGMSLSSRTSSTSSGASTKCKQFCRH